MELVLIFPESPQEQAELRRTLARFHAEQALKITQHLPCSTEQKLELINTVISHVKNP